MLLVVGVIITSLSFQNLENYSDEKKERYVGPVMIAAGILVIARGAFGRLRPPRSELSRRRSFLRRYIREMYSRPIFTLRSNTSLSLCDIQITDIDECSRTMLHNDEPPSYELATSDEYLSNRLQGRTNLANSVEGLSGEEDTEAPPTYEEFMRSESFNIVQTTRL
ncbi:hypothetical protein SNE40_005309 [Patella caerulea]